MKQVSVWKTSEPSKILFSTHSISYNIRFTPQHLVDNLQQHNPPLKLVAVVDLTFTNRYYTGKVSAQYICKHNVFDLPLIHILASSVK